MSPVHMVITSTSLTAMASGNRQAMTTLPKPQKGAACALQKQEGDNTSYVGY